MVALDQEKVLLHLSLALAFGHLLLRPPDLPRALPMVLFCREASASRRAVSAIYSSAIAFRPEDKETLSDRKTG